MEWRERGARAGSTKQGLQNSRTTTASESSERQTVRSLSSPIKWRAGFTEYVKCSLKQHATAKRLYSEVE